MRSLRKKAGLLSCLFLELLELFHCLGIGYPTFNISKHLFLWVFDVQIIVKYKVLLMNTTPESFLLINPTEF